VFDSERRIKEDISFENLAAHIWFTETKTPMPRKINKTAEDASVAKATANAEEKKSNTKTLRPSANSAVKSPFLGVHDGTAYALLYNGVLHDKKVDGGNVLTHKTLALILRDMEEAEQKPHEEYEKLVIYGEATKLPAVHLKNNDIEFKQTPYDIKVW
jgi:adenine-specific DNA-methyltransferase